MASMSLLREINACAGKKRQWVDVDFPPDTTSLSPKNASAWGDIVWLRPKGTFGGVCPLYVHEFHFNVTTSSSSDTLMTQGMIRCCGTSLGPMTYARAPLATATFCPPSPCWPSTLISSASCLTAAVWARSPLRCAVMPDCGMADRVVDRTWPIWAAIA